MRFRPVHLLCTWTDWPGRQLRQKEGLAWSCAGGDDGNRTHDIYLAKVALCQLSYVPETGALTGSDTLPVVLHGENLQFS